MSMSIEEIIWEIEKKVERNKLARYDIPVCNQLLGRQTNALIAAVKALRLSEKFKSAAVDHWAKNTDSHGRPLQSY